MIARHEVPPLPEGEQADEEDPAPAVAIAKGTTDDEQRGQRGGGPEAGTGERQTVRH